MTSRALGTVVAGLRHAALAGGLVAVTVVVFAMGEGLRLTFPHSATNWLIDVFNTAWAVLAAFVVAVFGKVVWVGLRTGVRDRPWHFALGLALAWAGTMVNRAWNGLRRVADYNGYNIDWMLDHPILLITCAMGFVGGVIHLRMATMGEGGNERKWSAATASALLLGVIGATAQ